MSRWQRNTQPNKLTLPNEAIAAGIRNTPAPIILPTTSDVADHNPNLFLSATHHANLNALGG
jgi:hypothetical protein